MSEPELLRFHADALREYIECWSSAEARDELGVSEEEAAYHILQHAAMLLRYTNDERSIAGLLGNTELCKGLVVKSCRYIAGTTLNEKARELFSPDILDSDELEQSEDLLLQRDALESVLWLAIRLVANEANTNVDLRRSLATARCVTADLDEILLSRLDIVSVAYRPLAAIKDQLRVELDPRNFWWFGEIAEADRKFTETELVTLLELPPDLPQSLGMRSPTRFASKQLAPYLPSVQLAAADSVTARTGASVDVRLLGDQDTRVIVSLIDVGRYQFVFVNTREGQRSTKVDGCVLDAETSDHSHVRTTVSEGIALLECQQPFTQCSLIMTDGNQLIMVQGDEERG